MTYTRTLLSFSILTALILVSVFGYSIYEIRSKGQEASTLTNQADEQSNQETLALSIQSMRNNSKAELATMDQYVLKDEKLVPFIEFIQSSGKSLGLETKIASVSVDKTDTRKQTAYDKVQVVVETTGPWAPSLSFIHYLENLPTHASIDATNLEVGDEVSIINSSSASSTPNNSKKRRSWHTTITLTLSSFK